MKVLIATATYMGLERTKIAIRVSEDRLTTSSRDMTILTTIPTSTFQMIENTNVGVMSMRSTHDRILDEVL